MPELLITHADGRTRRHILGRDPLIMGRDATCDLSLDDPSTSRQHAQFSLGTRGHTVEDLGSKNGTLVNDRPCSSVVVLKDGDRVLVGSTLVVYKDVVSRSSSCGVVLTDDAATKHATRYVTRESELHLSQQRLKMIYELSAQLTTLQGYGQLLENALTICFETLHFDRGAIGVRRLNQRTLDWPVVRNLRGAEGELAISRTLLRRALEHGERAIFSPDEAGAVDPTVSMIQQGIRSAMCVPLIHKTETLGVIYGDRVHSSTPYAQEDIDFLAGIAQQISIGVINCRLADEQKRMIRLSHDLDLARNIQTELLPTDLPRRGNLTIDALNDPGQHVSGDYYDVMDAGEGKFWCLIADVTGEGVSAAILMANLQAAVRVTVSETNQPSELLTRWNRLICRNTHASKFITCLLLLVDPEARVVRCASAGHFAPLILRGESKEVEELPVSQGFPLGVDEEETFATSTFELGPDPALLVTYTDGIVEAMNAAEEMFGMENLLRVLGEGSDLNPQALVKRLRKAVTAFADGAPQSDDITILALRIG